MTRIGVISDTHMRSPSRELCALVEEGGVFADADMILHAGDIVQLNVLDALAPKEVVAVCGNMDFGDVPRQLPQKRVVEVEGKRIGLIHGWGFGGDLEKRILPEFEDVDSIVYGHTHRPANRVLGGVLMFNPGSFGSGRTVGILEVGDSIRGGIIEL